MLLLLVVGCAGASRAKPIPPRQPLPPIDAAFFETTDTGPKMRVHAIDIGQGAATLVEFSCGAILIDTGGEENRRFDGTQHLVEYLRAFFKSRPDLNDTLALLVLTHPHIDHTRGATIVLGEFNVERLVTNGQTTSSGGAHQRRAINVAKAKKLPSEVIRASAVPAGGLTSPVIDPIACPDGDPDIRVLWGAVEKASWGSKELENLNNHSIVVRVTLGKSSLLITGDLEEDGIHDLLGKHRGTNVLDVDLYQVGHHGSYNATTKPLLAALTPKLALIQCGPFDRRTMWTGWQYGHPRAVTIDMLERSLAKAAPRPAVVVPVAVGAKKFEGWELTVPIYATGWDGDVIVTMASEGQIHVKTRRGN